jgi:hypothetical protein
MAPCALCIPTSRARRAIIKRPKTGQAICKECFFAVFEEEIHQTIVRSNLFRRGERVGIAASGGKGELETSYFFSTQPANQSLIMPANLHRKKKKIRPCWHI